MKRFFASFMIVLLTLTFATCGWAESGNSEPAVTTLSRIDNTKWSYNAEDNVYYQIGIVYCANPADESFENLAIFVPSAYMNATDNGDGTYTCTVNEVATCGDFAYTAATAPIAFPVNTPGYGAQASLTQYTSVTAYTAQGFVYVHAGCRDKTAGAPAAVTDLKAAIRYIRYNAGNIAGNTDRIFTFGMSGGGAQSALMGVTGDSALYDDYLQSIGAVQGVSDAVLGSQAWCPITSLESADAAYEWNMGNTRSELSEDEQALSDGLTAVFASYINGLGLTDTNGNALTLDPSEDGRYQSGTYYEWIKSVIEDSLNQFLANTVFPYNADSTPSGDFPPMGNGGFGRGQKPEGMQGTPPEGVAGTASSGAPALGEDNIDFSASDNITRIETTSGVSISGTYETVQDYIDALNANGIWVIYDEATNTATVTSIAGFAAAVKGVAKGLGAFDQTDATQGENVLFGIGTGEGLHFDAMAAEVLEQMGSGLVSEYVSDFETVDFLGHDVAYRLNMYSPLYYLLESSEGYKTSTVATYFRINAGLWQSDTSVTTEINLALALENYGSFVDSSFVWGQKHVKAETNGDATTNFIAWVNQCLAAE